jgi:GntR family transcriptional regulator
MMSTAGHEEWQIEFNSGIPVYKQIINYVSFALASGRFKEGDRLPTIRQLHAQLNVNPNTVAKAYRELELKGIINSERGSGSFIKAGGELAKLLPEQRNEKLRSFYRRMLAEAAVWGLTEQELIAHIKERKDHEPDG